VTLDQFLGAFASSDRRRVRQLFDGLSNAVAGRGQALGDSLAHAAPVAGNLDGVLSTLSGETSQLQQLFNSSGSVLSDLGKRQGDLQAAVTAGNEVLNATAVRNQQLVATVRALPPFLTQLRATSRAITSASGDLNHAFAALLPIAPLVLPALAQINTYGPEFKGLFQDLPATIAAGKRGLPSLAHILNAIPGAFNQLYPTSRQLIPLLQLLATYKEEALIAPLSNSAALLSGTSVGPGGRIFNYARGALYVSNETVVGAPKRTPTNRSNPYPTPDGYAKLGQQGFLDSYDCRNIHNFEYLPPLGTGVPPCVQQGPWNYRGTTAFYPRLEPSPP
jgi:ABC-type transporter Mla subunit MlaD